MAHPFPDTIPMAWLIRRTALSQPVELSESQVHEGIQRGSLGAEVLIQAPGETAMPLRQHPLFGASFRRFPPTSGEHGTVDPAVRERLEALKRRRSTSTGLHPTLPPGAGFSGEQPLSSPRNSGPFPVTTGPVEPFEPNRQWRGRPIQEQYRALLDVPAMHVFGLPWQADRASVSIALARLTDELEKEAPKPEPEDHRSWREQILGVLAAIHSAYINSGHQRAVARLQAQVEREPFVHEVIQFYVDPTARARAAAQRRDGDANDPRRELMRALEDDFSGTGPTTDPRQKNRAAARSGRGADAAGDEDPVKAAEKKRILLYAKVGGVVLVLLTILQLADC
jgi:hypothetical protein